MCDNYEIVTYYLMHYVFHRTVSTLRSRPTATVIALCILIYFVTHTSVVRLYYYYDTGMLFATYCSCICLQSVSPLLYWQLEHRILRQCLSPTDNVYDVIAMYRLDIKRCKFEFHDLYITTLSCLCRSFSNTRLTEIPEDLFANTSKLFSL